MNISQKPREEFWEEIFTTRDSSQKWLKFEVYSPLIWGAKGEIFIPACYLGNMNECLYRIFRKYVPEIKGV